MVLKNLRLDESGLTLTDHWLSPTIILEIGILGPGEQKCNQWLWLKPCFQGQRGRFLSLSVRKSGVYGICMPVYETDFLISHDPCLLYGAMVWLKGVSVSIPLVCPCNRVRQSHRCSACISSDRLEVETEVAGLWQLTKKSILDDVGSGITPSQSPIISSSISNHPWVKVLWSGRKRWDIRVDGVFAAQATSEEEQLKRTLQGGGPQKMISCGEIVHCFFWKNCNGCKVDL